jgi:hypothetical protein
MFAHERSTCARHLCTALAPAIALHLMQQLCAALAFSAAGFVYRATGPHLCAALASSAAGFVYRAPQGLLIGRQYMFAHERSTCARHLRTALAPAIALHLMQQLCAALASSATGFVYRVTGPHLCAALASSAAGFVYRASQDRSIVR